MRLKRLRREMADSGFVIPPIVILGVTHVFLCQLVWFYDICVTDIDVMVSLPQTKYQLMLYLMRMTNAMLIVCVALRFVQCRPMPRQRRRAYRAACIATGGVLLAMQLNLKMHGDMCMHFWHSHHAADTKLPPAERIEHYTAAIDHFPGEMSKDEYLGRAHAYRLTGEHARAVAGYDEYQGVLASSPWECDPGASTYCGRAISLLEIGEPERAREDFAKALEQLEVEAEAPAFRRGAEITAFLLRHPAWSIKILSRLGGPDVVTGLIALLKTEHAEKAARALGKIGDARAVPTFLKVLDAAGEQDYRLVGKIAEALGRIGDARAVSALVRALVRHAHDWTRERTAMALARIAEQETKKQAVTEDGPALEGAAIPALLVALDLETDNDLRAAAVYALYRMFGGDLHVPISSWYDDVHYRKGNDGLIELLDWNDKAVVTEKEVSAQARRYLKRHPDAAREYEHLLSPVADEDAAVVDEW